MRSAQLSMRWIPVADASGRTRVEAVWMAQHAPATSTPASTPVAATEAA